MRLCTHGAGKESKLGSVDSDREGPVEARRERESIIVLEVMFSDVVNRAICTHLRRGNHVNCSWMFEESTRLEFERRVDCWTLHLVLSI